MRIYIPTYRRPNVQTTFHKLPRQWQDKLWFVVREDEEHLFKWHPRLVIVRAPGAPEARQAALLHCVSEGETKLWMFDDDLTFSCRSGDMDYDSNGKEFHILRPMTLDDMDRGLSEADSELDTYAAVAFSARGFNNGIVADRREGYRMMMAFGVRTDFLAEHHIRFNEFKFWEDFHVTLEILKRGYPNLIMMDYCHNGVTNKAGGVSTYRTRERLLEEREKFIARHAPYAIAVEKKAESWGQGMSGTVPDLKIDWAKALREAPLSC